MIFFDVSQAREVAMVIPLHRLEGEDDEEAPAPDQAMGREQPVAVRLTRVAVEVGDDRRYDEIGHMGINEERNKSPASMLVVRLQSRQPT